MIAGIDTALIVAYVVVVLAVGLLASKRETTSEFLIAGRDLGLFRFVATYVASVIGGGTLVAYMAFVYEFGISAAWAEVAYCATIMAFTYYALKLRRMSRKEGWYTLPDYFYARFGHGVGLMTTLIILCTSSLFLIGQLIAGAMVLSVSTGWTYTFSLLLGAVVVFLYLVLGGFNAVVVTDIFQYLLMIIVTAVVAVAFSNGVSFSAEQLNPLGTGVPILIGLVLFSVLTVIVSPELWQRIYAARDDRTIKWGMPIASVILFVVTMGFVFITMVTKTQFPDIVPEQALAYGFTQVLPPMVLGLGLVLLFASIMSSADTIIFALSTVLGKNVLRHHERLRSVELKRVTRLSIIIITVAASLAAYLFPDIIKVYTVIANVVFSLAPVTILSFHTRVHPKTFYLSVGSGILTLLSFIGFGILNVEIAALSFVVSLAFLVIGHFVFKDKKDFAHNL